MTETTETTWTLTRAQLVDVLQGTSALFAGTTEEIADAILSQLTPDERWWITTGPLPAGGEKRAGPFASQGLALAARTELERAEGHERYWVWDEITSAEPAVAAPGRTAPDTGDGS